MGAKIALVTLLLLITTQLLGACQTYYQLVSPLIPASITLELIRSTIVTALIFSIVSLALVGRLIYPYLV
ncbi:MAG: hypothetical protein BGO55_06550 [Sphingobacteriales bacterium 50-39]|nr:MAG: hypothetical protein BGO55_06550 [Sphingobacteriales bacterium 50-39]